MFQTKHWYWYFIAFPLSFILEIIPFIGKPISFLTPLLISWYLHKKKNVLYKGWDIIDIGASCALSVFTIVLIGYVLISKMSFTSGSFLVLFFLISLIIVIFSFIAFGIWTYSLMIKTKWTKSERTQSLIYAIFSLLMIIIVPALISIYLGYKSIKNGFKKIGFITIILGVLALFIAVFFTIVTVEDIYNHLKEKYDTEYPLIVYVSSSMEHDGSFEEWWQQQKDYYLGFDITKEDFQKFKYPNGVNNGDIAIIRGVDPAEIELGDIIIYKSGRSDPIMHRVIEIRSEEGLYAFQTKGDHNIRSINSDLLDETEVAEYQVYGKVVRIIPKLGMYKIWILELREIVGE